MLPGGKLLLLVLSSQFFDGYELESVVAFGCQTRRKFASGSLVVPVVDDNVVLLILFFDQNRIGILSKAQDSILFLFLETSKFFL